MDRQELIKHIKDAAYVEGDFTLRSGRKSSYIIDKYAFETDPRLLASIADELVAALPPGATKLAGVELGGVPLAVAVSLRTRIPYIIVRKGAKEHGLDRPFEGDMDTGETVVLLEDVSTTGGAAIRAARVLLEHGAGSVTVMTVVDRQEGAAEAFADAGITFQALFTRRDLGIGT